MTGDRHMSTEERTDRCNNTRAEDRDKKPVIKKMQEKAREQTVPRSWKHLDLG